MAQTKHGFGKSILKIILMSKVDMPKSITHWSLSNAFVVVVAQRINVEKTCVYKRLDNELKLW